MNLLMFLENKLVDEIPINAEQVKQPGVLRALQQDMEEKNEDILVLSLEEPTFFIDSVPSSMNTSTTLFTN